MRIERGSVRIPARREKLWFGDFSDWRIMVLPGRRDVAQIVIGALPRKQPPENRSPSQQDE